MKSFVSKLLLLPLFLLNSFLLFAQERSFDFVNQPLTDIVYILSSNMDVPVVCDETVNGNGSFLYIAKVKETATHEDIFEAFLKSNRLYVNKSEKLWSVSKIRITEAADNCIIVDCYDTEFSKIIGKISEQTGITITYDFLPSQKVSFHSKELSPEEVINTLFAPYDDYTITKSASGLIIKKVAQTRSSLPQSGNSENSICEINKIDESYYVRILKTKLSVVLDQLFELSGKSYSSFINEETVVQNLFFEERIFEETLQFIIEQCQGKIVKSDDIFYLLPNNSGSATDTIQNKNRVWEVFTFQNKETKEIQPLIAGRFQDCQTIEISKNKLAVNFSENNYEQLQDFLSQIDLPNETYPIKLKYIKTDFLYANLPPSVNKDNFIDAGTGDSCFFCGSKEKLALFLTELEEIDKPRKLIRYDLLILQYQKSVDQNLGISSSVKPMQIGDRTMVSGEIGNLLGINFDAISVFGLTFSTKLSAALSQNKASVFADTTLYGLAGEKVSFKNTNTYRYRDVTSESSTSLYSSITREITSGLVLEIESWVSGDEVITMDVKVSVSKQGVDLSKNTGNPPPTSEKNINTKVRAKNGEPIILSGLSQTEESESNQNYVLGISKNIEKTEMTIYLVPHIEDDSSEKTDFIKMFRDLVFFKTE